MNWDKHNRLDLEMRMKDARIRELEAQVDRAEDTIIDLAARLDRAIAAAVTLEQELAEVTA